MNSETPSPVNDSAMETKRSQTDVLHQAPPDDSPTIPSHASLDLFRPTGFKDLEHIGALDTVESRLALIGGASGVVSGMLREGIQPTVKTFTLLLHATPSDTVREDELIKLMTAGFPNVGGHRMVPDASTQAVKTITPGDKGLMKVQPDRVFFNTLIERRIKRGAFEDAKVLFYLLPFFYL